jgi:hypothetical protein
LHKGTKTKESTLSSLLSLWNMSGKGLGDVEKLFEQEALRAAKQEQRASTAVAVNPFGTGTRVQPADDIVVRQVSGSTAGANSGDFHVYRNTRRVEMERLAKMDADAESERLRLEFEERRRLQLDAQQAKTAKKAEKRKRAKQLLRQKAKARKGAAADADDSSGSGSGSGSGKDEEEASKQPAPTKE